jgi:hypothetical protein
VSPLSLSPFSLQDALPLTADPALVCSDIDGRRLNLERLAVPIMSKPVPPPPKAEPKPEPKAEAKADAPPAPAAEGTVNA